MHLNLEVLFCLVSSFCGIAINVTLEMWKCCELMVNSSKLKLLVLPEAPPPRSWLENNYVSEIDL